MTPIFVQNLSRSCLFHKLSATITQEAIEGAKVMMKDKYHINCGSRHAWNESKSDEEHIKMYVDCTKDIADSSPQIKDAICDIQEVAKGNYSALPFKQESF